MTIFEMELSGGFGEYRQKRAEKELETTRAYLETGEITIDGNGVARNCIGRALMDDLLERLAHVTDAVDVEATREARSEEVDREIAEYRKNAKPPTAEHLAEMRAAFGEGEVVVNILTGQRYYL